MLTVQYTQMYTDIKSQRYFLSARAFLWHIAEKCAILTATAICNNFAVGVRRSL